MLRGDRFNTIFRHGGQPDYIGYSDADMDTLLTAARTAVGEGQTLLAYSSLQKKLARSCLISALPTAIRRFLHLKISEEKYILWKAMCSVGLKRGRIRRGNKDV